MHEVLHAPVRDVLTEVLGRDLLVHGHQYLHELIGTLGWLDLPAAEWLVLTHTAVLAVVILSDGAFRARLTPFPRTWATLILVASLAMVEPRRIGMSIVGALALNLTLALNHRPGRYVAF